MASLKHTATFLKNVLYSVTEALWKQMESFHFSEPQGMQNSEQNRRGLAPRVTHFGRALGEDTRDPRRDRSGLLDNVQPNVCRETTAIQDNRSVPHWCIPCSDKNQCKTNCRTSFMKWNQVRLSCRSLTYSMVIKMTISSIVIGLKNSHFPLIHLPSCYQTVCYRTACYRTVQQTNHIQGCSLNQLITLKVVV